MARSRFVRMAAGSGAALLGFLAFLLATPAGAPYVRFVTHSVLVLAALAAAVSWVMAGRRVGSQRCGPFLLAAAWTAWAAGTAVWAVSIESEGAVRTSPELADAVYMGMPAFAVAGLLALGRAAPGDAGPVRAAIDCLIVAGSLFLLLWMGVVAELMLAAPGPDSQSVWLAYMVAYLAVTAVAFLAASRAIPAGRAALLLIAAGISALVLSDLWFVILLPEGDYAVGHPVAFGWVAGMALLTLAPWSVAEPGRAPWTIGLGARAGVIPGSLALAALVGLFVASLTGHPISQVEVSVGFAVLVLVVVQLLLTLHRNHQLVAEVEARERHFRALVSNSSDVITLVDRDGTIRYQSPAVTRMLGHCPDALRGRKLDHLVHPEDVPAMLDALRSLERDDPGRTVSLRLSHVTEGWRHVESTVTPHHDPSSGREGVVLNIRDITQRQLLQAQLAHQAYHDTLTGLANRSLFMSELERTLSARAAHDDVGVLFIDLDDFKSVNDTLGHAVGDQLLVAAARRLRGLSRPGDTVARLGGDEFAILLPHSGAAELQSVARRVADAFTHPFVLADRAAGVDGDGRKDHELAVSASIGVASAGDEAERPHELLRNADLAMYRAKHLGKGRCEVFEPALQAEALARRDLEAGLREALDAGDLQVYYQPIVELGARRIVGLEALVRWVHPERGVLEPAEFLGAADSAGLVGTLSRHVLERACGEAAGWRRTVRGADGLSLTVNLSASQLRDEAITGAVGDALRNSGLPPSSLVLEVTPRDLVESEECLEVLTELQRQGLQLAVDGFGTGSCSFPALYRLPIRTLKMDRWMGAVVATDARAAALTTAVVEMGRTLGLTIIATGIENEPTVARLQDLGCELGQGFHLGRPLPPADTGALLARHLGEPPRDSGHPLLQFLG